jgi:hypothetical protein
VVVVVNTCRHGCVVVVPLTSLDFTVSVTVSEVRQELQEHLVFSHLTLNHLRVERGRVNALKIGCLNRAAAVAVELEECLVNHSLTLCARSPLNTV